MPYSSNDYDIAIIGMSGRFPEAPDLDTFWQNLKDGKESVRFYSEEELDSMGVPSENLKNPDFIKAASILEDIDCFDAAFFGYSPKEAKLLDPQQRIFLECAWHALENGGYASERNVGLIGVFGSSSLNTYLLYNLIINDSYKENDFEIMIGNDKNFLSTKVAYHMNLKGPAVDIQTACSSSLSAIHYACNALLNYECDMSLAGGVSVYVPQRTGYIYKKGNIMSSDGKCRAFDKAGNGTVFGNGVGVILLKRMSEALKDNDTIHAVIKSSSTNNDGSQKIGYAAPSIEGQVELVTRTLALADIPPKTISYVEAHGTGTEYGDPVEVAALTKAFNALEDNTGYKQYCAIGSVKNNIGHLDAASGVAGVIKTVLALKNKQLPPLINFEQPNPKIDFIKSPFYVNTRLKEWSNRENPRRAGVNSLGIGGTNVFLILEEAPELPVSMQKQENNQNRILILSGRSGQARKRNREALQNYLSKNPENSLDDIVFTMHAGRNLFPYRQFLICKDRQELAEKLSSKNVDESHEIYCDKKNRPAIFLYPDLIQNRWFMGRQLYREEVNFKELINDSSEKIFQITGFAVKKFYNNDIEQIGNNLNKLLMKLSLEYALSEMLEIKGIKPYAMAGKGTGVFSMAFTAGVMGLDTVIDCLQVLSKVMGEYEINDLSKLHLIPSERQCQIAALLIEIMNKKQFHKPRVPLMDSLTGALIFQERYPDRDYWIRLLFSEPLEKKASELLTKNETDLFLIMGAKGDKEKDKKNANEHEKRLFYLLTNVQEDEGRHLAAMLGAYICNGGKVDVDDFYREVRPKRVSLPGYCFEKETYWVEPDNKQVKAEQDKINKYEDISNWTYMQSWKRTSLPVPEAAKETKTWLLFGQEEKYTLELSIVLKKTGQKVIISPLNNIHFSRLFDELRNRGEMPQQIIYLWTGNRAGDFEESQDRLNTFIKMVQSWDEISEGTPLSLWIIGTDIYKAEHTDKVNPYGSYYLGLSKVIPQEYPYILVRTVDMWKWDIGSIPLLISELLSEMPDREISYRGRLRYTKEWINYPIRPTAEAIYTFREQGTYMILGGTGKIGMILAGYLVTAFKAKVMLVSRNNSRLNQEQNRKIQEMEQAGGIVKIFKADIGIREQLEAATKDTIAEFGKIDGIIHCAGIVGSSAVKRIAEYEIEVREPQFNAKINGSLLLPDIVKKYNPDFVLLISSIASVLGGEGLLAYTVSNLFLDNLVYSDMVTSKEDSTRWITMNLDWISTEGQINIAGQMGQYAIKPNELIDVFERVVTGSRENQVVISTGDLPRRLKEVYQETDRKKIREKSNKLKPRPVMSVAYVKPYRETEKRICKIWSKELEIDRIGRNDNFFELGGNSLIAIHVISQVKKEFKVDISTASLYEKITPALLATEIEAVNKDLNEIQEKETYNNEDDTYEVRKKLLLNQRKKRGL